MKKSIIIVLLIMIALLIIISTSFLLLSKPKPLNDIEKMQVAVKEMEQRDASTCQTACQSKGYTLINESSGGAMMQFIVCNCRDSDGRIEQIQLAR